MLVGCILSTTTSQHGPRPRTPASHDRRGAGKWVHPLRGMSEVRSISMKVSECTSSEASQYSERPALSMAAVSSTLQLSQKVCASELLSLRARPRAS